MGWQGKKDGFMGENCISGAFMIVKNYKNILLDQSYNDLGFQVGSRLVVLVEAQASWTPNIIVRCLMYLAQTYQEYFESTGQNVYSRIKIF